MSSAKSYIAAGLGIGAAGVIGYVGYRYWKQRQHLQHNGPHYTSLLDEDKIHVISTQGEWDDCVDILRGELKLFKVLGFDCEWANDSSGSKPISLVQLATLSGDCFLVRLHLFSQIPTELREILADKSILKTGVACVEDGRRLHTDYGLCVRGCVDIRHIVNRVRNLQRTYGGGLKDLTQNILGVSMDKTPRRSNWEADQLSQSQIHYGALDALVGVLIFEKLIYMKAEKSNNGVSSTLDLWQKALSLCQGIVDVPYSMGKGTKKSAVAKSVPPGDAKSKRKDTRYEKVAAQITEAYVSRKEPLYHNCQLWAPDGQLLCTCDIKKAQWYIEKGLANKVKDDPFTVQLKFEPSGRPINDVNYYTQDKKNICVVCGAEESYIRKNVIPHEYRKHFPPLMKEHKSHDILLLCLPCHQVSSIYNDQLKQQLALECDAPLDNERGNKYRTDNIISKVKSAGKALLNARSQLPPARRDELEKIVRDFYGVSIVDTEILKQAIELDEKIPNSQYTPHGEKVVQYMMENQGLVEFERMWREHFIRTNTPKYLPSMWSVNHHHDQLAKLNTGMTKTIKKST